MTLEWVNDERASSMISRTRSSNGELVRSVPSWVSTAFYNLLALISRSLRLVSLFRRLIERLLRIRRRPRRSRLSIRVSEPHPIVRLSPTGRAEEHQWWCGSAPLVLPVTDYAVARAVFSLML